MSMSINGVLANQLSYNLSCLDYVFHTFKVYIFLCKTTYKVSGHYEQLQQC